MNTEIDCLKGKLIHMNILFIGKRSQDAGSGIEKKMMGQIHAFEELGHKVKYTFFNNGMIYLSDTTGEIVPLLSYRNNIVSQYISNEKAISLALKINPKYFDMFYMRKGLCSPIHLLNLKRLKKEKIRIIEEIPTYPYDKELLTLKGIGLKVFFIIDKLFRIFMKKYVDYIVTYSEDTSIFEIPAISINNGIEMKEIPMRVKKTVTKPIRILTVSTMYFWHGYDRLIRSLAKYYETHNTRDVYIEMVGDGVCRKEWERLTSLLGIEKYVTFHGMLSGKELDTIYDQCDIAAASLAPYRKGMTKASELKIREYCARGIPFVLTNIDLGLHNEFFYYKLDNDDSLIDIEQMVRFALEFGSKPDNVDRMRAYAQNNFTWGIQIQKILNQINGK